MYSKKTKMNNEFTGRTGQTKRLIKTIIRLSIRGYTVSQIAELHDVSTKTVRRDFRAIEDLEIPLYENEAAAGDDCRVRNLYYIDAHWMKRFVG